MNLLENMTAFKILWLTIELESLVLIWLLYTVDDALRWNGSGVNINEIAVTSDFNSKMYCYKRSAEIREYKLIIIISQ